MSKPKTFSYKLPKQKLPRKPNKRWSDNESIGVAWREGKTGQEYDRKPLDFDEED